MDTYFTASKMQGMLGYLVLLHLLVYKGKISFGICISINVNHFLSTMISSLKHHLSLKASFSADDKMRSIYEPT